MFTLVCPTSETQTEESERISWTLSGYGKTHKQEVKKERTVIRQRIYMVLNKLVMDQVCKHNKGQNLLLFISVNSKVHVKNTLVFKSKVNLFMDPLPKDQTYYWYKNRTILWQFNKEFHRYNKT